MNFFGLFKRSDPLPGTAPVARERLQVLLAHERGTPRNSNRWGRSRKISSMPLPATCW